MAASKGPRPRLRERRLAEPRHGGAGGGPFAFDAVDRVFRAESGRVVAGLIGAVGDIDVAEESVQDAFVVALERWPREGLPANPGGWIALTARRRAIDRLRRQKVGTDKLRLLAEEAPAGGADADQPAGSDAFPDDRLRLIFTCCHPALARPAQVALTLRLLGGLRTPEIARAFLLPEQTLAQRLVRAKRKIRAAGVPYEVPGADELPARLASVLHVLYLVFNEGYAASSGAVLVRRELCAEAIRLTRVLVELMPREAEALGLLALLLLQDSRRDARQAESGELVLLAEQDRSRWDGARIEEGLAVLDRAAALVAEGSGSVGAYQLQAAIAAVHALAGSAAQTDWPRIVRLYDRLAEVAPSAVVELNRAVAVSMAQGPAAGLAIVDRLAGGDLDSYHLLHASRAELLRRLGRDAEAAAAFTRARDLATNEAERRYLHRRRAEVAGSTRA